jgi:hypothetical protein
MYQLKNPELEQRKLDRYGYSYAVYKNLADKIKNPSVALILLPPQQHVKMVKETRFGVVEPCMLYYYTGLRSVWADSKNARQANYEVLVKGPGKISVRRIHDKVYLDSLVTAYKQMLTR